MPAVPFITRRSLMTFQSFANFKHGTSYFSAPGPQKLPIFLDQPRTPNFGTFTGPPKIWHWCPLHSSEPLYYEKNSSGGHDFVVVANLVPLWKALFPSLAHRDPLKMLVPQGATIDVIPLTIYIRKYLWGSNFLAIPGTLSRNLTGTPCFFFVPTWNDWDP